MGNVGEAMTRMGRPLQCVAAFALLAQSGWAQSASAWRGFKAADGLPEPGCVSVTVGAHETVLARHLNAPYITRLDGYSISVFPSPPPGAGRVYASPAGQLWAASPSGLHEFTHGGWIIHFVPEIAEQTRSLSADGTFNIPLLPIRQGRVLFLLRDRLMMFSIEADRARTETVRLAADAKLGDFYGLAAARDGGLWISAANGLARLPAPARNMKFDTGWRDFKLPENLQLENLREPREDLADIVCALAERPNASSKWVVQFDGERWATRPAPPEAIAFACSSPEQTCWAVTSDALFSQRATDAEMLVDEELSARRFFDVAAETGGAFWVATSDGLFRHAPATWRTPAAIRTLHGPVHSLTEDREAGVWFATGRELHQLDGERRRNIPFPQALRHELQNTRNPIRLADGSLLFETEKQLLRLHPKNGEFENVSPSDDHRLQILGVLKDGTICLQRVTTNGIEGKPELEIYDGEHFKPFPQSPPPITNAKTWLALFQTTAGDLWLTDDQTVSQLHDGQWKTFTSSDRPAPQGGLFLVETADGRIYCATMDALWVFDGQNWELVRSGFDHVNALVRGRDDSLWIASNNGLHRFAKDGWIENAVEEGLPSATIRGVCVDRRGQLWAATGQGLSVYHPEADLDPPRTEIYSPTNQHILEGGGVTVGFLAQDKWKFTPRNRLLYSHRLDERDWSPFQEATVVTFGDLTAGEHSFQVRAMDRNGNIEPKPAQWTFSVELPWYRESRLVAIGGAALIAVIFFAGLAFNRHRHLRHSYADVERKVTERTRELEIASRELLHSQKMNALGTLAAGIAHDFNNILSIIKGSAQIIEENLDNRPKVRTRLDRIKTVVEQGTGIVQAMLGFSRSSDELPRPTDLNEIVDDTLTLLGDRFLREAEVIFERAPDLPAVPVAKDFVQQVLLNLVFNAAESMSNAKRIVIRTQRLRKLPTDLVLKPGDAAEYISISVEDFGCGIPPENLARIFEPFFTTKALSKRRGTGLGLSMVYELAKRMNAGLTVHSVVSQGSKFTLILPVAVTAAAMPVQSQPVTSSIRQ